VAWTQAIIYYSFTTLLNLYLFRDQFFFPTFLGGSGNGECSQILMYLPYTPHIPYAQRFYMFQLGGHIYSTIHEIMYKRKEPKFAEMILHHGMTIFLISYSYLTNNLAIGILVLYTHDPGDVFLALVRMYNEVKSKNLRLLDIFYGLFVFVWVFFRLTSFPICIIGAALNLIATRPFDFIWTCYAYLTFMLCGLVLLHYYWFLVILKILVNLIQKKQEPNMWDKKKIN
jgi:ceramide synthetase